MLIIYHASCYDGFTAAWIFKQKYPNAKFHPATYGEMPPYELADGGNVVVVDFSYKRKEMVYLNQISKSLLVLDHHKTAKLECEGLDFCQFDMDQSGAGMAARHVFGPDVNGGDGYIPAWILSVERRDLWKKLPGDDEAHAYLTSQPMTFESWSEIDVMDFGKLIEKGRSILDSIDRYCEVMHNESILTNFANHLAIVCNAPYWNCSELMNYSLKKTNAEIAMCFYMQPDGKWKASLRSTDDGPDVSAIAKSFGGGGHHNAAGFTTVSMPL